MPSANEELRDATIKDALSTLRVSSGTADKTSALLRELESELVGMTAGAGPLVPSARRRLEDLLASVQVRTGRKIDAARKLVTSDMADLGDLVTKSTLRNLNGAIGADLGSITITKADFAALTNTKVVQGRPLESFWEGIAPDLSLRYEKAIRTSLAMGETNEQMIAKIVGRRGEKPILQTSERMTETLVRTSFMSVNNHVMLETIAQNADLVKALKHHSTLDSRTSLICQARSRKRYKLKDGKVEPIGHNLPFLNGAPYHPNCRSIIIPVLLSFKELSGKKINGKGFDAAFREALAGQGFDPDEIAEIRARTQASMDGQVPRSLTFEDFALGKGSGFLDDVLGPGRAKLFTDGKISFGDLLNNRGGIRTIEELKQVAIQREVAEAATRARRASRKREDDDVPRPDTPKGEAEALATAPARKESHEWPAVKSGKGGTRDGIRWNQPEMHREAGDAIVEVDLDQLRAEHVFATLSQEQFDALVRGAPKALSMPRVDMADNVLRILDGEHRVLYAVEQGAEKILVSVPSGSALLRKIAQRKQTARRSRSRRVPEHPAGRYDTIAFFADQPIQNKGAYRDRLGAIGAKVKVGAKLSDSEKQWLALFDDQPNDKMLGSTIHRAVFKGDRRALAPDEAAEMAYNRNFIPEPSVDALYVQLGKDAMERRNLKVKSAATIELEEGEAALLAMQKRFEDRFTGNSKAKGELYLGGDMLREGDMFQADDEVFRVIERDRFGGLVLEGGENYPNVYLEAGKKVRAQTMLTADAVENLGPADLLEDAAATLGPEIQMELDAVLEARAELEGIRKQAGNALGERFDRLANELERDAERLRRELKALGL